MMTYMWMKLANPVEVAPPVDVPGGGQMVIVELPPNVVVTDPCCWPDGVPTHQQLTDALREALDLYDAAPPRDVGPVRESTEKGARLRELRKLLPPAVPLAPEYVVDWKRDQQVPVEEIRRRIAEWNRARAEFFRGPLSPLLRVEHGDGVGRSAHGRSTGHAWNPVTKKMELRDLKTGEVLAEYPEDEPTLTPLEERIASAWRPTDVAG